MLNNYDILTKGQVATTMRTSILCHSLFQYKAVNIGRPSG